VSAPRLPSAPSTPSAPAAPLPATRDRNRDRATPTQAAPSRSTAGSPPASAACALALSLAAAGVVAWPSSARAAAGPEGPVVETASPPDGSAAWTRACSQRHPLCVHAAPRTVPAAVVATLAAAERAWDTLTGALELPPPDGDADGRWHAYLVDGVDGGSVALASGSDPVARFDRASSFALVDRGATPGCALDVAVARAVARGSLWRSAPSTDEGSARAESHMLARLVTPCTTGFDDDRIFQNDPERSVVDPTSPAFDRGAGIFFEWLDANFAARPGALVAGLWALSPTRTPASSWRWTGTPTGFDVLRVSLKDALFTDSTLDDVLVRFAVHRALVSPEAHAAWHVPWPAKARRFASPFPVAPTGASYVLVDMAGAPAQAKLRVEAAWEDFGRMRWEVVKLDAAGRAMADVAVTSTPIATNASMTVELLDGVDRILVIGANVGSTEHPFDPQQGWWEPHGWLLTVEGQ
jgi:hypothetical protein